MKKISTHRWRNFTDNRRIRDLIQLGGHRTQGAQIHGKKSLPRTGIDHMPLAFKASVLACF